MSVFNEYARYYDLLYRDKDYAAESAYVHGLLRKQCPAAVTLLNLGCGSGRHDRELVKLGYRVVGIDMAEGMLEAARRGAAECAGLEYQAGDVRTARLGRSFDAVISLFHVMSYQRTNADLLAAFRTAHEHLQPGGLFLFDCWYGPGVLTERPERRIRQLEDECIAVTRLAEPLIHANDNCVDVTYRVTITDKGSGASHELQETHGMRYLFRPEVSLMLELSGFELLACEEWMTGAEPGFGSWNVVFAARRISDN